MATNRLSDVRVKAFVKESRAGTALTRKLSDGAGLYLMLTPAGTPCWRVKYRLGGKEKVYAVGVYPEITLERAREERDAMRSRLRVGQDPVQARQLERAGAVVASDDTFGAVAAEWLAKRKQEWSDIHYLKSKQALERDVLPFLGKLPVAGITTAMVSRVYEKIVARGTKPTASKIAWNVRSILDLAKTKDGWGARENPAAAAAEVIGKHKPHVPRAALLTFPALGDVLRRTEVAALSPAVRMCLRLVAFTASRIGNAVEAQWKELALDGDVPTWTVPRAQMKMQDGRAHDHKVLLGPTIAAELRRWKSATGGRGFVFPSPHRDGDHVTREALEKVYRVTLKLEGKHSVHGWRASFATLARDADYAREVVELTLDHIHDNEVARAYDRGERLNQRLKLMHWWDANLLAAQHGGTVIPFKGMASA
jgi:integrase